MKRSAIQGRQGLKRDYPEFAPLLPGYATDSCLNWTSGAVVCLDLE